MSRHGPPQPFDSASAPRTLESSWSRVWATASGSGYAKNPAPVDTPSRPDSSSRSAPAGARSRSTSWGTARAPPPPRSAPRPDRCSASARARPSAGPGSRSSPHRSARAWRRRPGPVGAPRGSARTGAGWPGSPRSGALSASGRLPSRRSRAHRPATTSGSVRSAGTTSTSGIRWAGLNQCNPRNRSGRASASARRASGSDEVLAGDHRPGRRRRLHVAQHLQLQSQRLGHRLDDQLSARCRLADRGRVGDLRRRLALERPPGVEQRLLGAREQRHLMRRRAAAPWRCSAPSPPRPGRRPSWPRRSHRAQSRCVPPAR